MVSRLGMRAATCPGQWLGVHRATLASRSAWNHRGALTGCCFSTVSHVADDAKVMRIAAFSDGQAGGNPAGVAIRKSLPEDGDMRRIAAEVGFSETVFAVQSGASWRVRYFSPESEVAFCGHATIALGAALAMKYGSGVHNLTLNHANITVEGHSAGDGFEGALQSPPTKSAAADAALLAESMSLFGLEQGDLDQRIKSGLMDAGNKHLVMALADRTALSKMHYDMDAGRDLMNSAGLVTIALVYAESNQRFHVRNAFASGGVYEDPATGSAAAALAGYLRDLGWPHGGKIEIIQGEDMGSRSLLFADIPAELGSSIRVSGRARLMD